MEEELARLFAENGWTWSLAGRGDVVPDEDDIAVALDTAARLLYDENPETNPQIEMGRLIIKKTHTGHDVFVFTGTYQ